MAGGRLEAWGWQQLEPLPWIGSSGRGVTDGSREGREAIRSEAASNDSDLQKRKMTCGKAGRRRRRTTRVEDKSKKLTIV
jgi:hypothetical protein